MKAKLFAAIMALTLTFPVNAINTGGSERDIIVTMEDFSIIADDKGGDHGLVTIDNPHIDYKTQKGQDKITEHLTAQEFADLWLDSRDDNFSEVPPNAKLRFWDPTQNHLYETEFSIKAVSIPQSKSNSTKVILDIRFLDKNNPIHVTKENVADTKGAIRTVAMQVAQITEQLNQNKSSAVLIIDNSPWDP